MIEKFMKTLKRSEIIKLISRYYNTENNTEKGDFFAKSAGNAKKDGKGGYQYKIINSDEPPQSSQIISNIKNFSKDYILKKIKGSIR